MRLYTYVSRFRWPHSYHARIFVVCFVGTHVPLIAFLAYAVFRLNLSAPETIRLGLLLLVATAVAFAGTLYAIRSMLKPVREAIVALQMYRNRGLRPELPETFDDEAGHLLSLVQSTLDLAQIPDERLLGIPRDRVLRIPKASYFIRRGRNEFAHARRTGQPLSVIRLEPVDPDADTSMTGPDFANRLMTIAGVLDAHIESVDVLCRYEDVGFAVLLRSVHGAAAAELSRSMLARLAGLTMIPSCSFDAGVATLTSADECFEDMLARAELAIRVEMEARAGAVVRFPVPTE